MGASSPSPTTTANDERQRRPCSKPTVVCKQARFLSICSSTLAGKVTGADGHAWQPLPKPPLTRGMRWAVRGRALPQASTSYSYSSYGVLLAGFSCIGHRKLFILQSPLLHRERTVIHRYLSVCTQEALPPSVCCCRTTYPRHRPKRNCTATRCHPRICPSLTHPGCQPCSRSLRANHPHPP